MYVTLMHEILRGQVRLLLISSRESQKAEHLSPLSAGLFLVTVNLDLRE